MMQFVRLGLGWIILCCLTQPALAQTPEERSGARAAAEQGVKAFADGRWAEAADLMARAEKLVHAPTHLLYLAQAEEKLLHLVIAHETYLKILREKLPPNAPAVFFAAQEEAKRRAEALSARLSQVSIVVQGSKAGASITVTMDGTRIPDALIGVPHPVDPGEHIFEATADGMRGSLAKIMLREGASETVVLTLQATLDAPKATSTAPAVLDPTAAPATSANAPASQPTNASTAKTPSAPSKPTGTHPLKISGYVGLGVGALGLGVGTIFALRSQGLRSDADALCNSPDGSCPTPNRPRIEQLDDDADSAQSLAIVGFVTGGIGIAAGVTMLLLAPSSQDQKSGWMAPYFAGNSAGVLGRF